MSAYILALKDEVFRTCGIKIMPMIISVCLLLFICIFNFYYFSQELQLSIAIPTIITKTVNVLLFKNSSIFCLLFFCFIFGYICLINLFFFLMLINNNINELINIEKNIIIGVSIWLFTSSSCDSL